MTPIRWFLGWDAREMRACNVAEYTARQVTLSPLHVERISLGAMTHRGLYTRPTEMRDGRLWDVISNAPMSTAHAIARFLVPALCQYEGWALFTDGDVLVRRDLAALWTLADPRYAVQVVPHAYQPPETRKMDDQIQTRYARKNWSSVVLWHCGHPANRALTVDLVNTLPGRELHRFCWLEDALIGHLPPEWNWLAGHSSPTIEPAIVHFTEGLPDMPGYEQGAYSDAWYAAARACGYRLTREVA